MCCFIVSATNLSTCPYVDVLWTAGVRMSHGSPQWQWRTPQYIVSRWRTPQYTVNITANVTYTNWGSAQPDFSGSNEDCMDLRSPNAVWNDTSCNIEQCGTTSHTTYVVWNDISCNISRCYVCEVDMN